MMIISYQVHRREGGNDTASNHTRSSCPFDMNQIRFVNCKVLAIFPEVTILEEGEFEFQPF